MEHHACKATGSTAKRSRLRTRHLPEVLMQAADRDDQAGVANGRFPGSSLEDQQSAVVESQCANHKPRDVD